MFNIFDLKAYLYNWNNACGVKTRFFACAVIDMISKQITYATFVKAYGPIYQSIHGVKILLSFIMSHSAHIGGASGKLVFRFFQYESFSQKVWNKHMSNLSRNIATVFVNLVLGNVVSDQLVSGKFKKS